LADQLEEALVLVQALALVFYRLHSSPCCVDCPNTNKDTYFRICRSRSMDISPPFDYSPVVCMGD
jgi:hypothetical protein